MTWDFQDGCPLIIALPSLLLDLLFCFLLGFLLFSPRFVSLLLRLANEKSQSDKPMRYAVGARQSGSLPQLHCPAVHNKFN